MTDEETKKDNYIAISRNRFYDILNSKIMDAKIKKEIICQRMNELETILNDVNHYKNNNVDVNYFYDKKTNNIKYIANNINVDNKDKN